MADLLIGHLLTSDESKISTLAVKEGQVINSEKGGLQFIDYAGARHTLGNVLHGIYNKTSFINFSATTVANCLAALKDSKVPDGQMVNVGEVIYQYRVIGSHRLLTKPNKTSMEVDTGTPGYIIYLPKRKDSDTVTIDLLVSVNNTTHGDKTFLLKIANDATIVTASSADIDGDFDSSTCDVSVSKYGSMYWIGVKSKSVLKVISYSVAINGTTVNDSEGFYVASIVTA